MWIRRMFCRHDFEFTGNAKIIKHKGFVVLKGKYVCRKYEISDYGDASYVIDDPIVGWQDLPDPWE